MIAKKDIHPIGIGTFRIDLNNKEESLKGLMYSHSLGQNYIDTSYLYESGKVLEFLGSFFKTIGRENIFIAAKLENYIEKLSDIEEQLDKYMKLMDTKYVDCLELHNDTSTKIGLIETYKEMNRLVQIGKVKYLGISNSTLEEIKLVNENFKLFKVEGLYNLECKTYENMKVFEYCKENNIMFTAYQPLRRNRTATRNYPILIELANKYNKIQNQIILNWIIKEKGINVILKATNIDNIQENLEALNFTMDKEDITKLNEFRSSEFDSVIIDWKDSGGIPIHQLANQFN